MAGTTTGDFQNGGSFYLDPNQQDLLLAALSSNTQNPNDMFAGMDGANRALNGQSFQYPVDGNSLDPIAFFTSPTQDTAAFNSLDVEESPYVDYLDGPENFDLDGADAGGLMIGVLPGDSPTKLEEGSEKRKSPDDDDDEDAEGGGKRREGEDKQAKKPGRKPLTSEPTTKRKAQNRAAQRAFRERKEKHLKDLETKVAELEKASDATNHENGLLRAQVQRLQVELREYRKRLSLNSTSINRSPPLIGGFSNLLANGGANASNFQFEFPRFGGLPGSHILDTGPLSKNKTSSVSSNAPARQNSTGRSSSPQSQKNASVSASPATNADSRSGSINGSSTSTDTSTGQARVFHFNSTSSTHSNSPSASSVSAGGNSSCDTSPEPSHSSPKNTDTITDGYVCHANSEGITNPPATILSGIEFFATQNGGQFDPALFGEYRDSQNAIIGDGDFTNGFFNDAFPVADFSGSPFHFGDTPAVQKSNPLEELDRLQDMEDEVVPGEDTSQMLNCHKIWDKLASRPDFKDGTIDIDNLCSELRAKARCSESGVVVDHKDVEAALKRLPKDQKA